MAEDTNGAEGLRVFTFGSVRPQGLNKFVFAHLQMLGYISQDAAEGSHFQVPVPGYCDDGALRQKST